jgi:hypothetical protein
MGCMNEELWFSFKQGVTDLSPFQNVQAGLEADKAPFQRVLRAFSWIAMRWLF